VSAPASECFKWSFRFVRKARRIPSSACDPLNIRGFSFFKLQPVADCEAIKLEVWIEGPENDAWGCGEISVDDLGITDVVVLGWRLY
jgi:hypothetical protein